MVENNFAPHGVQCQQQAVLLKSSSILKWAISRNIFSSKHNRRTNCRAVVVIVIYRRVLQSPIALLAPPLRSDAPFFQTHAQKATLLCWSLGRKQIYCSSTVMPRHFSTQKYFFDHENGHTNSHLVCSRSQTNQIAALEEERAEAS